MINLASTRRPLAAVAAVAGLLVAAAPASSKGDSPTQRAVTDGTSNTVMLAARHWQPEVDDEVLAREPRADGIIAILIGAVATPRRDG